MPFDNAYVFSLSDGAVRAYQHYLVNETFPEGAFSVFAGAYPVAVKAALTFVDVFGDSHEIELDR